MVERHRIVMTEDEIEELVHSLDMAEQEGRERKLGTNRRLRKDLKEVLRGERPRKPSNGTTTVWKDDEAR